ncbi:nuclear factor 7, brain-like [Centropristis striata]|uniref:nuclear factor 7, brain-like n=1 Tax=Centropristis striata TaxID=184440 RepID=UPI0027E19438|nr:nuclear factor 7, brain-like [Centropristis striata]
MATVSCLLSEDQFLCSICLDVFTDPVSTPCGHNFCKNCITEHWNVNHRFMCPLCNETFTKRPDLRVNTLFSEMVGRFRQSALQEASSSSSEQQKKVRLETEIQQMIQKRRLKIQEIRHQISEGVQVFTALKESVERGQANLIEMIKEKQKRTEKQAEGFIKELDQEISDVQSRNTHHPTPTKDWTEVSIRPSYEGTVVRAVAQLEETLRDMKKLLPDFELKRVQQFAVDVTLDPDTAHPALTLSGDGKQVSHGKVKKNLPNNQERFEFLLRVLGIPGFSSGRFYYEVQVNRKTDWDFGVARESINRKGKIELSPENGFWTMGLRNRKEYKALANPGVSLSLKSPPQKVGMFVDYEEGLISFYDVDAAALIYSFTGCSFTGKLFPFFSPHNNEGGKNSAPLIISPVGVN